MPSRPAPQFEPNLKDLFPENLLTDGRNSGNHVGQWHAPTPSNLPFANQRPSFSFSDSSTMSTNSLSNSMPQQPRPLPSQQYDPNILALSSSNNNDIPNYDMYDFDFLMSNDNLNTIATFTGDSGLNLGFDAHHDWADGGNAQLPDLFGGFFFGGPAGEGQGLDGGGYPTAADFGDAGSSGGGSLWNGGQDQ